MMRNFVYVIRCGDFFKIGRANTDSDPLTIFKSNNPYRCDLVLQCFCQSEVHAKRVVKSAHSQLKKWERRNEWYHINSAGADHDLDQTMLKIREKCVLHIDENTPKNGNSAQPTLASNSRSSSQKSTQYKKEYLAYCEFNGLNPESATSKNKFKEYL
jgi:hypothetical protein